jgi:hypothetical protein
VSVGPHGDSIAGKVFSYFSRKVSTLKRGKSKTEAKPVDGLPSFAVDKWRMKSACVCVTPFGLWPPPTKKNKKQKTTRANVRRTSRQTQVNAKKGRERENIKYKGAAADETVAVSYWTSEANSTDCDLSSFDEFKSAPRPCSHSSNRQRVRNETTHVTLTCSTDFSSSERSEYVKGHMCNMRTPAVFLVASRGFTGTFTMLYLLQVGVFLLALLRWPLDM